MKPRSLAYQFPTLIYIKHEKKNLAHLDTHMMGKFYCKNFSNCCFSRQVWNYRWSGNFLAFAEINFEASAFLLFHISCWDRNSGSNHVTRKVFFICITDELAVHRKSPPHCCRNSPEVLGLFILHFIIRSCLESAQGYSTANPLHCTDCRHSVS